MSTGVNTCQRKQIYFSLFCTWPFYHTSLERDVRPPSSPELVPHKEWVSRGWSPRLRADQDSLKLIKKENNLHWKRWKCSPGISCPQQPITNQCPQCHLLSQKGTSALENLLCPPLKKKKKAQRVYLQHPAPRSAFRHWGGVTLTTWSVPACLQNIKSCLVLGQPTHHSHLWYTLWPSSSYF